MELHDVRPQVQLFAMAMESQLRKNDHKGGWEKEDLRWLMCRVLDEFSELREALESDDLGRARVEASDAANFLMMVWDNAGTQLMENLDRSE